MPNAALDAYEADWQRRKAISARYGGGSLGIAAVAFVAYMLLESNLPESPRPDTAHTFWVFYVGRTYGRGPMFVYGTHIEQILAWIVAGIAQSFGLAGAIVYYVYNPGAFYRQTYNQFRHDD